YPGRRQIVEIASKLRCRREPILPHLAAALFVPLFRPKKEGFILCDRPAYGVAVVVAAQIVLFSADRIADDTVRFLLAEEKVCGVELIVAAVIVGIAMKPVPARFGDEVFVGTAGAAIFGAVAVAQDLKFLDRVYRRIDKNGALRAFVIIFPPVPLPLVGIGRCAAEGDINSRQQALVLVV